MVAPAVSRQFQKLDGITLDKLLADANPFQTDTSEFDLRGIQLITPAALVGLAAGCHALAAAGRRATITVDDIEVRRYLMRSCFVSVVEPVAEFSPGFPTLAQIYDLTRRGSSPML